VAIIVVGVQASSALAAAEDASFAGASADGAKVFFQTPERMVPADTDGSVDVYERSGGTTTLISQGQGGPTNGAFDAKFEGASADGTKLFFETSEALSSADTDGNHRDVYERSGGVTSLVSGGGTGAFDASFEGAATDGSHVFFETAEPLAATDTDASVDVFDRSGVGTTEISVAQPPNAGNGTFDASFKGSSDDGTQVFFKTAEPLVATDADSSVDVYRREGAATSLISRGQTGGDGAFAAHFKGSSVNGSDVFFTTSEPLVTGDTDTERDIYDRSGGNTTRVSVGQKSNSAHGANFEANSTDGDHVFFSTHARMEATDTDTATDIYDRSGVGTPQAATTQVSVAQPPTAGNSELNASFAGNSADGAHVFFESNEQLASTDTDPGLLDVYDRTGGATIQVSQGDQGAADASYGGASSNGMIAFFETRGPLAATDADNATDVYQRSGGATMQISRGSINGNEDLNASFKGTSDDGGHVFFNTEEPLVKADADNVRDVYQRSGGVTSVISVDLVPPQTKITKGKKRTPDRTPTFKYTSTDPGSTFKCKLDRGGFKTCKPKGFTTKRLRPGKHTFQVRATDSFGNVDKTPAKRAFNVAR